MKFSLRTLFVLVFVAAISIVGWRSYVDWKYGFTFSELSVEVTSSTNTIVVYDKEASTIEIESGDEGSFLIPILGVVGNRVGHGAGLECQGRGKITKNGDEYEVQVTGGGAAFGNAAILTLKPCVIKLSGNKWRIEVTAVVNGTTEESKHKQIFAPNGPELTSRSTYLIIDNSKLEEKPIPQTQHKSAQGH